LSKDAQNWQQYNVESLVVEYIPTIGTQNAGEIILSPEYDVENTAPLDEVSAMQNYGAVSDVCWTKIMCPLDRAAMHGLGPRKYVRTGPIAGDLKTYDAAKIHIFTNNFSSSGTSVGKIFFRYKIKLMVPQSVPSSFGGLRDYAMYRLSTDTPYSDTSANIVPVFGTKLFDTLGTTFINNGQLDLPPGNYRVDWTVVCDWLNPASTPWGMQLSANTFWNGNPAIVNSGNVPITDSFDQGAIPSSTNGSEIRRTLSGFSIISFDAYRNAVPGATAVTLGLVLAANFTGSTTTFMIGQGTSILIQLI
jgi:hypothetical protein